MKRILRAFILFAALAAHTDAYAEGSTLRVACKGNDIGADVSVNGQFKGECPLDIKVSAGTARLRLVKKVDEQRERVFEQDIRLGDGVTKQSDVVLSAPRLSATAQTRENERLPAQRAEAAPRRQPRAGAEPRHDEALTQQLIAAIGGDVLAMLALGDRYADAKDAAPSPEQALAWYRQAAAAGNPSAMARLAAGYETGAGADQSFAEAFLWYREAAEAGDAAGMAGLGAMYANGTGVAMDLEQARHWWSKGAAAGDGRAMNGLGVLHRDGSGGLAKDIAQAVRWFEKAAETGQPRAMTNLASLYYDGIAVPQNIERALFFARQAGAAAHPDGMNILGLLHGKGLGVKLDHEAAAWWFRKAAEAGSASAMNNLAAAYYDGRGIAKNQAEAIAWLQKAAANGSSEALQNLRKLGVPLASPPPRAPGASSTSGGRNAARAPPSSPDATNSNPLRVTASDAGVWARLEFANIQQKWAVWGFYYLYDCVNVVLCDDRFRHPFGVVGPLAPGIYTHRYISPADPCLPYSFKTRTDWTYYKTADGRPLVAVRPSQYIKVQGRTPGPEAGPFMSTQGGCAGETAKAAAIAAGSSVPAKNCGMVGQVSWIKTLAEIPKDCRQDRQESWARARPGMADFPGQHFCALVTAPLIGPPGVLDANLNSLAERPKIDRALTPAQMRSLSGCYCGKNIRVDDEVVPLQCWMYYDKAD